MIVIGPVMVLPRVVVIVLMTTLVVQKNNPPSRGSVVNPLEGYEGVAHLQRPSVHHALGNIQ